MLEFQRFGTMLRVLSYDAQVFLTYSKPQTSMFSSTKGWSMCACLGMLQLHNNPSRNHCQLGWVICFKVLTMHTIVSNRICG